MGGSIHYYIIAQRFNRGWRASFTVAKGTHLELTMYLPVQSLNVLSRYYNVQEPPPS